ncbi:RNA polymerase sigma factor [Dictyobacter alpinus]|uniref:RNA polymerase sigma factor n=1 Tax=Dictyobacter alpinus TaxID=2014873 RepID=A0A402BKE0_9CHLR|nr:sigma-70 family RNA polymerase sigma factor [Dictyobacter alpinus]GCE31828.1 RNA polymerase sigma factor [Dictyobacter alpinus]
MGATMLQTNTYQNYSDTQLIYLCCNSEQLAFEELLHRYNRMIFNYLYRLLGDSGMAEDLSQEVFLRVYTALPNINAERPFKPWLFQVAHNCCIDELRRRRRQALPFSSVTSDADTEDENNLAMITDPRPLPDEMTEHFELRRILSEAIQSLPIKYRAVTTLRYQSQLSFSEIGNVLHMPEATAKTYFSRAKKTLRTILTENYHYALS